MYAIFKGANFARLGQAMAKTGLYQSVNIFGPNN